MGLSLTTAIVWSIGVTLVALLAFGAAKARFTVARCYGAHHRLTGEFARASSSDMRWGTAPPQ
jgi:VIT1/CCC1 family predicted Fe2+/Mn2+ transporter